MFADSLLESAVHRPTRRRSLSLLTSLALEALVVAVLVAIPLVHPDMLSAAPPRIIYEAPFTPWQGQPTQHPGGGGGSPHPQSGALPIFRPSSPNGVYFGQRNAEPIGDPSLPIDPLHVGPPGNGTNLFTNARPMAPVPPPHHAPVVISHFDPGTIVHQVLPIYPELAKRARIQGDVKLQAIITREGTIAELTVVSGHPMLAPAALDAVRQWRFRPYLLNGQAVPVETTITVNFHLGADGGAL